MLFEVGESGDSAGAAPSVSRAVNSVFCLRARVLNCFCSEQHQVMKGQAAMTIMDSATSEYEVVTEYCGLAILPETVNPQHCEYLDLLRIAEEARAGRGGALLPCSCL